MWDVKPVIDIIMNRHKLHILRACHTHTQDNSLNGNFGKKVPSILFLIISHEKTRVRENVQHVKSSCLIQIKSIRGLNL